MTYYYQLGQIPPKRHTQFHQSDGSLFHEELIGLQGFSGRRSLLYHLHPPTVIKECFGMESSLVTFPQGLALRPWHLRTEAITKGGDVITGQVPLLGNQDFCLSICSPTESMDYWFRWALGDLLFFIHQGQGLCETQFGTLVYGPGDYLIIPGGILWRLIPDFTIPQRMLIIESQGHLTLPQQYLNQTGQLSEQSPFCERDIHPPTSLTVHDASGEFEVRVKTNDGMTRFLYQYHPLDVIGWDGYLWPYRFNIKDFEPITGRIHQPPPVHQTFTGPNFVVCSFVPRLFDYHPQSIPAPYNHSNVDTDEVLYYVAGQFMSRRSIDQGSITLHPRGISHGPHPGKVEASIGAKATQELAVMIDAFHPLQLTQQAMEITDSHYLYSWYRPVLDPEGQSPP